MSDETTEPLPSDVIVDPSNNVVPPGDPSYIMPPSTEPPPPDVLTLADLLSDQSVVQLKEQADKATLETIWTQPVANFRPKLVEWVMKGRPSAFPIFMINVQPPPRCSDGETRDLADYIQFCSGKTIAEHVGLLQAKLPDIQLSFANIGGSIAVVTLMV